MPQAMNNTLTIRHVETVRLNGNPHVWLELSTDTETRQCCYTWNAGGYCYVDGDKEPDMSPELAAAWEKADRIIQDVARTNGEATICP